VDYPVFVMLCWNIFKCYVNYIYNASINNEMLDYI
jgi:hypothetical protein